MNAQFRCTLLLFQAFMLSTSISNLCLAGWYDSIPVPVQQTTAGKSAHNDMGIRRLVRINGVTFCLADGVNNSSNHEGIYRSNDNGINWTLITNTPEVYWTSITWSQELSIFVVCGASGSIMTSSDGVTWLSQTGPNTNTLYGITWSPELSIFCAVAGTGSGNRVTTSII